MTAAATSRRRRAMFQVVLLLWLLAMLEVTARGYLRLVAGGSLLHPERVLYGFYPDLGRLLDDHPDDGSHPVEVLLLGGSVLNLRWSSIQALVAERLSWDSRRPVHVHNLAFEAHTTRDSLIKYKRLGGLHFDLVVVYHGINETRTNNAPAEVFRDDYGHYSWYRFVNAIDRDRWLKVLALPYAIRHAGLALGDRLGWSKVIPTDEPRPEWLAYGVEVKSAGPFRRNLSAILDLAAARHEPVLLMTFATYIPEGYSDRAFSAMQLDYTRHRAPLKWWGTPEAVRAGVAAHNDIVRQLAAVRGTWLVDQAALMPGERRLYDDPCHLTVAGSEVFVDNMMPVLRRLIEPKTGPGQP